MEETENKRAVEIDVADALLDTGLLIKVPAPRPLRMLGIKVFPMRFRRPVYAQLLRISRMYVRMHVDLETLETGEAAAVLTSAAKNGVRASRLIALGLIRSGLMSALFHRAVAAYLRRRMDAQTMAELAKVIVLLSGAGHFTTIIRSIAHLQVTTPNLQPGNDGELRDEGPHSPFGALFQIASQGVWTWRELMYKVPWSVVLAAINDQPKYGKKKPADEGEITSEAEAKKFFNLA